MLEIFALITEFVKSFGYLGIFCMTFVESTFVPLPAEITLIPAGYLASKGEMHLSWLMLSSILGTIGGAWLNYWIAKNYGRNLILKYGHYFFMNATKLAKLEKYFLEHGAISTFTGRLIPGLRHYISFPAGLAKMDIKLFFLYTALGGGIWISVLLSVGYLIGANEHLVKHYIFVLKIGVIIVAGLIITGYAGYIFLKKKKEKDDLYKRSK